MRERPIFPFLAGNIGLPVFSLFAGRRYMPSDRSVAGPDTPSAVMEFAFW